MAKARGECCVERPATTARLTTGIEEKFAGFDVYSNWTPGCAQAILLEADVFGWKMNQLRELADKIAAAGYVTVVPDFLYGDPLDSGKYNKPGGGYDGEAFLEAHPAAGVAEDSEIFLKEMKEKGFTSIGVVGFCYGGRSACILGGGSSVDAVVMCHPSRVTIDEIKALAHPVEILAAEFDTSTPVQKIMEFEKCLQAQDVIPYFVKIFPDTEHGWTVNYDTRNEQAVKSAEEAHADIISWFKKYLK